MFRTRALTNFPIGAVRHKLVLSIEIEDNGPGVPADLAESIFYPLVTGRAGWYRPRSAHLPGPGEPARRTYRVPVPAGQDGLHGAAARWRAGAGTRMNGRQLSVWVVDDDASVRWVLDRALNNEGMNTRTFESADSLFEALTHRAARCADFGRAHARHRRHGSPAPAGEGRLLVPGDRDHGPRRTWTAPWRPTRAAPSSTCPSPSTWTMPWPWCAGPRRFGPRITGWPGRGRPAGADDDRPRASHAGGLPYHRPAVPLEHDAC